MMCRGLALAFACALILISAKASADGAQGPLVAEMAAASIPFELAKTGDERQRGKKRRRDEKRQDGASDEASEPSSLCDACASMDGYVAPDQIGNDVKLMVGKTKGADKDHAVTVQKARGATETGLVPAFINGAACPEIDSETWAIDYSHKRSSAAIHKGIDIPQPRGTPIRAVAAGTVVGKFANRRNRKGIEVMLRHAPAETGLAFWTYSQYTHLLEMSPLEIGAKVAMGDEIGKTANTGKMGRRVRRDALHFAIMYSADPRWTYDGRFIAPKDGYWMDPNAFYRLSAPYDSVSLAALTDDEKQVPVPYMKSGGGFVPADTKRIWPYPCE